MKVKLTLDVDRDAVLQAKRLAKKRGVSVSALFEQWASSMELPESRPLIGMRLRGLWKSKIKPGSDPRLDYLMEKHHSR